MDFLSRCKENLDVCGFGLLIGALIVILIVLIYNWMYQECFVDPNSLPPVVKAYMRYEDTIDPVNSASIRERFTDPNAYDPVTKSLLKYQTSADPLDSATIKEYLENKAEHPGLVTQLWAKN